jgi:hypothetical protein
MRISSFIFFLSFFILLFVPVLGLAAVISSPSLPYWGSGGLVSCTGNYYSGGGTPCTSLCDLIKTFINVIYFGITLVLFVAAPILFAWGGLMLLFSGGNPGRTGSAKKILTGTLVGILIVLCAYLIISEIITFLGLSGLIQGFNGSSFSCNVYSPGTTGGTTPSLPSAPSPPSASCTNPAECTQNPNNCCTGYSCGDTGVCFPNINYACVAKDGTYACSPSNSPSCSDAQGCSSNQPCIQISAPNCINTHAPTAIYTCNAGGTYACATSTASTDCSSAVGCDSGAACIQIDKSNCGSPISGGGCTNPPNPGDCFTSDTMVNKCCPGYHCVGDSLDATCHPDQ